LALFVVAVVVGDRLFPPPLERVAARSALVVDATGAPLRAFAVGDGVWRFPADPARVDPLYLRMLLAWEDHRFASHPGIDPLALGRAMSATATELLDELAKARMGTLFFSLPRLPGGPGPCWHHVDTMLVPRYHHLVTMFNICMNQSDAHGMTPKTEVSECCHRRLLFREGFMMHREIICKIKITKPG
jgi:hypothetical protein